MRAVTKDYLRQRAAIFSFLLDLSECETVYSSLLSDLRIA